MNNKTLFLWSALNKFGVQLIYFAGNIILARVLLPDDFGLVAMLSIVTGISMNLVESGISDYLISKKNIHKSDYGTALTLNALIGFVFCSILFFSSTLIANFFERAELIEITKLMGLVILLKSFSISEFTRLKKELKFKTITKIEIISITVSILCSITIAYQIQNYKALVYQQIILSFSNIVLLLFFGWKMKFYFSLSKIKSIYNYSIHLIWSFIFAQLSQNFISVIIGKTYSAGTLGLFRQANRLKELPISAINSVILHTSYPLMATVVNIHEKKKKYSNLLSKLVFAQTILIVLIFGISDELIIIIYGDKWIESSHFLKLLLLMALANPIMTINANIAKIEFKTKLYRNLAFIRNGAMLLSLMLLSSFSIETMIIGQIVIVYTTAIIDVHYCGKLINFSLKEQSKIIFKQLLIPFISLFIGLYLKSFNSNHFVQVFFFLVSYFISSIIFYQISKNEEYYYFIGLILKKTKKRL